MNIMRSTSLIRKLAFLAIIWGVAIAVLLAGAELVLRVTDDGWDRTLRLNLVRSGTYDFQVSDLYESQSPTIRYERDEHGLRDDCAPSDVDILTVGGSTTDQRLLAHDATYQAVMQAELTRAAGRRICVSNAGVDGHSTHGHLRAFRDWFPLVPGLKPKIYVFYIGINDAEFTRSGPNDYEDEIGAGYASPLTQLRIVRLGLWVRDLLAGLRGREPAYAGDKRVALRASDYTQARVEEDTFELAARNAARFRLRLRRMISYARNSGGDVICVTQPHRLVRSINGQRRGIAPFFGNDGSRPVYGGLDYDHALRLLYRVMREECGERRFVDLYSAAFEDGDFYDYVHTTPAGSRKIGLQLARFIVATDSVSRLSR